MSVKPVSVITGAAGGIGRAVMENLAQDHRVAMLDVTDAVHDVAAEAIERGLEVQAYKVDVTDGQGLRDCVKEITATWGRLDVFVGSAGLAVKREGVRPTVLDMTIDEWQRSIAVNLTGAFLSAQAVLPPMLEAGYGRIVLVSSQAAEHASHRGGAHYAAAKTGMIGLVRTLALEVADQGVTVNSVNPGLVATPLLLSGAKSVLEPDLAAVPVGRLAEPREIAEAVRYLASKDAAYVTGSSLSINGGRGLK